MYNIDNHEAFDQGYMAGARSAADELSGMDQTNIGLLIAHYGTHARTCARDAKDQQRPDYSRGYLLGRADGIAAYIDARRAQK